MASKKKKKKKSAGARKPTYAKGKKVEAPGRAKAVPVEKTPAAGAKKAGGGPAAAGGKAGGERGAAQQWNIIRKGTLEARVMLVLLAIIAAVALARYPLTQVEANAEYRESVKRYNEQLEKWREKYPSAKEQEKHEKQKPVEPGKPTGNVILISVLFGALQSAIFAFLGLNILRRTDMGTPVLDRSLSGGRPGWPDLRPFVTWSLPTAVLLLVPLYVNARISENLINMVFKPAERRDAAFPLWKLVLGSLNDGVFYFVLFVFTGVAALAWLFTRYRAITRVEPHWAGIAAAFLFSTGFIMLNVSGGTAGRAPVDTQILYSVALAVPVLPLGYVLWKKGLEYSLLAGLVGFALYPVMASFVIR